jgi:hypothetical protein
MVAIVAGLLAVAGVVPRLEVGTPVRLARAAAPRLAAAREAAAPHAARAVRLAAAAGARARAAGTAATRAVAAVASRGAAALRRDPAASRAVAATATVAAVGLFALLAAAAVSRPRRTRRATVMRMARAGRSHGRIARRTGLARDAVRLALRPEVSEPRRPARAAECAVRQGLPPRAGLHAPRGAMFNTAR